MASAAAPSRLERLRTEPLRGAALVLVVAIVWLAGALYCSGYEALSTGLDNWPASLWWSAAAVLPWLALFEWSKSAAGRRLARGPLRLAAACAAIAAGSLALDAAVNAALGSSVTPLALSAIRRLPAAGIAVLLILWSRAGRNAADDTAADERLDQLAPAIDWVGAADNYVELHIGGRIVMRRMTMRQAERVLGPHGFVRIHRRFLVNRARIESIDGRPGERSVRLAGGDELPAGRAFSANLKA